MFILKSPSRYYKNKESTTLNSVARSNHVATVTVIGFLAFLFVPIMFTGHAAATTSSTCDSLTVQLSDDKNYYQLTAKATPAPNETINGYSFDFGDKQSYQFDYGTTANTDRQSVTVQHTYLTKGTFTAIATVKLSVNGETKAASSTACHVTIPVGSVATILPNTGPSNPTILFLATASIAALFYQLKLRKIRL